MINYIFNSQLLKLTSSQKVMKVLCLTILTFMLSSCKIQLIADYDNELVKQIEEVQLSANKHFIKMQEVAYSSSVKYEDFVDSYIEIEAKIKSIYDKNKVKPLNDESTRNAQILLQKWRKYKSEHRDSDVFGLGDIKITQVYVDDFITALLKGEKIKEELETEN